MAVARGLDGRHGPRISRSRRSFCTDVRKSLSETRPSRSWSSRSRAISDKSFAPSSASSSLAPIAAADGLSESSVVYDLSYRRIVCSYLPV